MVNEVWFKEFLFSADEMVDSIEDLNRCLNVVLINSNLDEIRCAKLLHWNVDLECRSGFSITDSRKGSDEEGCGYFKHAGARTGDELATWVKVELQLLSLS